MHFVFLPLLLVLQTMPPQQQTRPGHACVEVRTDDTAYLIKVSKRLVMAMEDFDDSDNDDSEDSDLDTDELEGSEEE